MLFIILLLEGFVTISIEIITIRQLLPFFGGSVIITSIIIGIFLLFLALGYWRGGMHRHAVLEQLSRNFTYSLCFIGIGLSYSLIALFHGLVVKQLHLPYLLSLCAYLFMILAPIVYWLGQTLPLTTNLFNQQQRVSRISGKALFLNTLGSFLGALLTSLLLFQYFGVAWAVVVNCLLLCLLIFYIGSQSRFPWFHAAGIFVVMIVIFYINIIIEHTFFKKTTNYANYRVIEPFDFSRILQMNESNSSLITADKKGFPYIEWVRHMLFNELQLQNKKILVIGAGGFSLTAAGRQNNDVTYVDIDPQIKNIAEKAFLRESIQGTFSGEDARSYLQHTQTKFDVILSDVYSNQATIPQSLLTLEYFQALADHLNSGGLVIINIIANPFFQDRYARIVFNTIHAVFPYCNIIPIHWQYPIANILYVCPLSSHTDAIYRDNLSTATTDSFNSMHRYGH